MRENITLKNTLKTRVSISPGCHYTALSLTPKLISSMRVCYLLVSFLVLHKGLGLLLERGPRLFQRRSRVAGSPMTTASPRLVWLW